MLDVDGVFCVSNSVIIAPCYFTEEQFSQASGARNTRGVEGLLPLALLASDTMYRPGHYGASLVAYAPVGFVAIALGGVELALAGGAVAVAGAMVPDWDQRVPFVRHRGPTHTVWFTLLVGGVLAVAGALLGSAAGFAGAVVLGAFGFVVGATIVVGHLLADVLTPMGIRPFGPLRDDTYTLDVAKAANPIANYALLALGAAASVVAVGAGGAVAGVLGL